MRLVVEAIRDAEGRRLVTSYLTVDLSSILKFVGEPRRHGKLFAIEIVALI